MHESNPTTPASGLAALSRIAADRAARPATGVPAGWKIVPVEPTQEMIDAAYDAQGEATEVALRDAWPAMLNAAPPSPNGEAQTPAHADTRWTLIAPDGRRFQGDSPIRCARAELGTRVSPEVQVQRIWDAYDEEVDAQERDAARYRKLRDGDDESVIDSIYPFSMWENTHWLKRGAELDKAVDKLDAIQSDAARAAGGEERK